MEIHLGRCISGDSLLTHHSMVLSLKSQPSGLEKCKNLVQNSYLSFFLKCSENTKVFLFLFSQASPRAVVLRVERAQDPLAGLLKQILPLSPLTQSFWFRGPELGARICTFRWCWYYYSQATWGTTALEYLPGKGCIWIVHVTGPLWMSRSQ